jgi:L-fuculose-phosphate aldolase
MLAARLTTGSGGNISARIPGSETFAISPTGIGYDVMCPKDIVVLDFAGEVVAGKKESFLRMAHACRRVRITRGCRRDCAHAFRVRLDLRLPARGDSPVHYLIGYAGHKVPLAPYATYGSEQLALAAAETLGMEYNAVLLATHGLLAVGRDLPAAFTVAEEIELVAQIAWQARAIGAPAVLPHDEMARVIEKFRSYGKQE